MQRQRIGQARQARSCRINKRFPAGRLQRQLIPHIIVDAAVTTAIIAAQKIILPMRLGKSALPMGIFLRRIWRYSNAALTLTAMLLANAMPVCCNGPSSNNDAATLTTMATTAILTGVLVSWRAKNPAAKTLTRRKPGMPSE